MFQKQKNSFTKLALKTFLFSVAILVLCVFDTQAQIRIGLWEPDINLTAEQKSTFINTKEKLNGIDDDKNGIIDDIFGAIFNDSGYLTGKTQLSHKGINNNLTEHGWAVYKMLSQSLLYFKIVHAGFTPLTQHLKETGILNLSIEERKNNLENEYAYYKNFALQTVGHFISQKVKIVNMSFGTSASIFADNNTNLGNNEQERKAVAKIWMQNFLQSFTEAFSKAPDILFVVAAGNDGEDMDSAYDVPGLASLPNVICVGALDRQCQPADFSNTGKRIDVFAQGDKILIKDQYGNKKNYSGTSLAVPIITRAAAILLQKNKALSAPAIKQKLIDQYKKNNKTFCKI